jgi:hypothetical protein
MGNNLKCNNKANHKFFLFHFSIHAVTNFARECAARIINFCFNVKVADIIHKTDVKHFMNSNAICHFIAFLHHLAK